MEISIDISSHVFDEIQNIANSESKNFDIISSKIIELGLRVYQSANNDDNDEESGPLLIDIFRKTIESNLLIKEMIGHVFDKKNSSIKAYDHSAAIHVIERMTHIFLQEKELV